MHEDHAHPKHITDEEIQRLIDITSEDREEKRKGLMITVKELYEPYSGIHRAYTKTLKLGSKNSEEFSEQIKHPTEESWKKIMPEETFKKYMHAKEKLSICDTISCFLKTKEKECKKICRTRK